MRLIILADARDPTRTVSLRTRFAQDATGRLIRLRADMRTSIVVNDAFGLRSPTTLAPAGHREWAATWDSRKVELFQQWLDEQEAAGILEVTRRPGAIGPEPWSNTYIRSSYQKGLADARSRLRVAGVGTGVESGTLGVAFHQPFHAARVASIYTRTFRDLKGVTDAMDVQMSRVLATGLAAGDGPEAIARNLASRVDKIGITRARLVARTEVVLAHNMGALGEYELAEQVIEEPVNVRWITARDERVRDRHRARHNKVYTRAEAVPLLGEPNCRCALIPAVGVEVTQGRPLQRAA